MKASWIAGIFWILFSTHWVSNYESVLVDAKNDGSESKMQYIICESDGGLSNRLRVLVTHIVLAKYIHNNARLVMVWEVNDACPGHFLQVFNPVHGVTFIDSSAKPLFAQHAVHVYNNSRDGLEKTLLENYKWFYRRYRKQLWQIEVDAWAKIYPTRELMGKVTAFTREHNVCNMNAMHVRRTDLEYELNPKRRSGILFFQRFMERQDPNDRYFLMTDNRQSQIEFFERFGSNKILVYRNISSKDEQLPIAVAMRSPVSTATGGDVLAKMNATLPLDHRFTTLEHAVMDVYIAAHAKRFHPTPFSSVSDYVRMVKHLYRDNWCPEITPVVSTSTSNGNVSVATTINSKSNSSGTTIFEQLGMTLIAGQHHRT